MMRALTIGASCMFGSTVGLVGLEAFSHGATAMLGLATFGSVYSFYAWRRARFYLTR